MSLGPQRTKGGAEEVPELNPVVQRVFDSLTTVLIPTRRLRPNWCEGATLQLGRRFAQSFEQAVMVAGGNGKRPVGRRHSKVLKAGWPKKPHQQAPSGSGRVVAGGGVAAAPARWTAAEKRARAAERAAVLSAVGEEEDEAEAAQAEAEEPAEGSHRPGWSSRAPASASQHGSHFAHGASGLVNDEWQTTLEAWGELAPALLPSFRTQRLWCPFYYDGQCKAHLTTLGFEHVYHEEADFFTLAADEGFLTTVDIIVDNPPYTSAETKEAVLKALMASGKPWCVLLPSSVLFSTLFREIVDTSKVQLVLPRRLKVCKTDGPPVPFKQMVWVCHGLELAHDLWFVGA